MKRFEMKTYKLQVSGEFYNEQEAIEGLADKYMSISKCDALGNSFFSKLANIKDERKKAGKCVFFFEEVEVFGKVQMCEKYRLDIWAFKKEHFWESKHEDFTFEVIPFEFNILTD